MDGDDVTREFILLPEFEKQWNIMGLGDDELKALQEELTINPLKGDVMQGTGGLRKIRISLDNRGKAEVQESATLTLQFMIKFILLLHILKV